MASRISRKVQEINAGSMADISFLLLIFFLVATTMNVDSGIQRMLPPLADTEQAPQQVRQRNQLNVSISVNDQIFVGGELMHISQVKDRVKEFASNPLNDPNMPEKTIKEIDIIGSYPVSQGVVSLQNTRQTSYNAYVQVQNELTRAFNELRNELSLQKFGSSVENLSEAQREALLEAIPTAISEASIYDADK